MGFLDRLLGASRSAVEASSRPGATMRPNAVASVPVDVAIPLDTRFTFLERVDYQPERDDGEMRGYHAMEQRSGSRFRTWRDDQDRVLQDSPPILPQSDRVFHRPTGILAAAGFMGPDGYEDPDLHPGNRREQPMEHVWYRLGGEAQLQRVVVPGDPWAIDVAADGSLIAGLWWTGVDGALCAVVDTRTGEATPLTLLKRPDGGNLAGYEEMRFSPDGAWLLLTTPIGNDTVTLVEVQSGRTISISCAEVRTSAWWPQRSPSSLLVGWIDSTGGTTLGDLNLASGELTVIGRLELPHGLQDGDSYKFGVSRLSVGPDGRSLLGLTHAATSDEWSIAHPRTRIARGELLLEPTGGVAARINHVPPAFLDRNGAAPVEHTRARWLDTEPGVPVEIASAFLTDSSGPVRLGG